MKRIHLHVSVDDLRQSIDFYSNLFAAAPTIEKEDYAKWMLDDPFVNFAISQRGNKAGLDHVGIQVEDSGELSEMKSRLEMANMNMLSQENTTCCYSKSDKYWVQDPSGIAWETYHTLESVPTFNGTGDDLPSKSSCCSPAVETIQFPFLKKNKSNEPC